MAIRYKFINSYLAFKTFIGLSSLSWFLAIFRITVITVRIWSGLTLSSLGLQPRSDRVHNVYWRTNAVALVSVNQCWTEQCIMPLFSWMLKLFLFYFISFAKTQTKNKEKERWQGHRNSCGQLQRARILIKKNKKKTRNTVKFRK